MSTNDGNLSMTAADILKYREIQLDKLAGATNDTERQKRKVLIDVSEQALDIAFMQTINNLSSNKLLALPEIMQSPTFEQNILNAANVVDKNQTEIPFKESTNQPQEDSKEETTVEIAIVVGDGYKEQINAVFNSSGGAFKQKIKKALEIAAENLNKNYGKAWKFLRDNYTDEHNLLATVERSIIFGKVLKQESEERPLIESFLKLRRMLDLTEEQASEVLTEMILLTYPSGGSGFVLNPTQNQIKSWYSDKNIRSLLPLLYDNILVGGTYNEKIGSQLIHHIVDLISPERRELLASRAAKRAATYKEKGYSN